MRVAILVLLLPALVLAYPYPQRSSEGVSRPSRGKQRFNIEELPASASDVEPTLILSRRGSSQRRSGYESQREPETASSVVAPVTQQLLSSRTSSQRRGTVSAIQATDDKFRSRSSFNRRTPSSQETVDRGFPSRRRESITETTPVPYKSPQVEQATLESNKENYPTPSVDIVRNPPPSETPAPIASSSSLPQPSNPTGINRRRTSNRNSDTTATEFSPRNSFPASDTLNERQTRFESSRRRQPSDIGQDTSASEGRRNGRRNLSRGTARANSADVNTNSVTSTQEFSNKSRNSGRRESTSARRGENISSSPVSFPSRSRSSSTQSRLSKENENINNDIPVQEIPDDPSLIASKRMDTIDDTSEDPVTPEITESIASEPESSSVSTEDNLASSSELPSTPDYSENTPKPLDILQSNRRKSSTTRSQSNSRDSVSNDRNPKSRSQTITQKAGINTNSRRGSARTSRVNDNNADYSTNSNAGYEEAFNVNAVNYRRDSSVISSNTEQFSQRSVINSRRNQPNTRGRTEESEASASGPSARVSLRRNWESSKSSNDINANVGTPTASVPSPRVNNSRRSSSSDTNRRLTGNERRGSRGYNADNPEPYVEETSNRRGSRTRSNATTRTELNSVDSVRPIARSGRRTSEPDVIATATTATTATTAQRTSRRTSPDVGRRGSVKTEKSVPDSDGNEKVANSLEIRKRGNNKVSEKKVDEPTVLKEKTRKVSLLLAPSPPSENIEQDSRHQSNDILLPRDQDKSKNIQQVIFKTSDETTESITFSRNSGRRPSKSDTTYPGSTTITKTRTALKSTRPQNRVRQIDAAVSKAPEALHQIISPTAVPAHRSTSKFGSNIHPDLDLSSAKAFEISSSVSPISHEYPLTTESYLSDISSGERTSEDTNSNSDLSTSTKKSGYVPRARALYKTSTVPPAPETSSKNSYSSRTRSSTPRPSPSKGTSSYKRRTSSTTPANVLETTPQSAFIQSPIAPPSPHRFSARYRNDLLRVTGGLRVTTTPAYVPTVPTVSTTTSTTSTTDSPYVENSSEALTLDASSLTLDATSLTLTDVDTDISLDSLEVAHSLKELNEIYPSSTEIDLPKLPNVLKNIDPPTSSSTVRTPSSTFTSLPEDEQSTTAASIKTKIATETPSKAILKTTTTRSVTSTTEITELKVTTLPTVAVAIKTTKIPKIITTPSATTSKALSMTTTMKTTASPTSTTTLKPTTPTTLKINTIATAKPSKTTKIPTVITTPVETTSEAHSTTTTMNTRSILTSTTTLKPTTSTTLRINTIAATKPTTTRKTTVASTVPNEPSTAKSSKIPTIVTQKTTEHTTSRNSASTTTTLSPSSSTFATVPARNNTLDSDSKENDLVSIVAQKESSYLTSELETPPRKKSVSTTPPPLLPSSTTSVPSGRFAARLTVAPRGTILSTTTIPPPPQFEQGMNLEVFSSGEPSIYNPPSPVRFIYTQPPPTTRRTPAPYVIFGIFPNNTIFRKFPDSDIKEIVSENEISRPQSYYPDEHHTTSNANNFYTSTQQPQRFANVNNFQGTNQQEYVKQDVQNTALYSLHQTAENEVLRTNAATFAAGSSESNVPAQISVGTSQPVLTETSTISSSTRPFPESAQDVKQVPPVIVQTPIEFSNSVYNGQDNKYKNFWSSTSTKKPEFRILTTDIPSTTPASVSSTSIFIVTPEPPTTTSTTTEVFRWKPTSPPSAIEVQPGTTDVTTAKNIASAPHISVTTTTTTTTTKNAVKKAETTTQPAVGLRGLISRVLVQHGTADVTTAKNTASAPHISVTTTTPAASVTPTVKVTTNAVTRAATTTTTTTTKKAITKAETTTQPTVGLRGLISRVLGNIPTSPFTSSTSEATPATTASVSTAIAPQPTPIPNAATTAKRDIATSNNSGSGISTTVKPVVTTKPSTTSKPPTTSIKPPSTSLKPLTSTTTTTTTTTTKKSTQTTTVKPTPPPTTTKKPTTPATTTKKPTTPTKKPVTTTKKPVVTTTTKRPTSTATTAATTKKPATTTTKKPVPNTTTKRPTTIITTTTKKLPATTSTTTKRPTTTTTTRKIPTTVTTTTKRPSTTTSPKPPTTTPSPVPTTTAKRSTPTTTPVIPAATSPKTASTLSKGFPANSFGDFAFLNSLLGGQQENKKRPGRERTEDLANKVIEIAIQRASTSTTTSHPTLTTKDSQLNFPGIMEQEEYEDRPRSSRDKDNNMANKVIEVAVQRASTSTAAPIAPLSSDETNTLPRKLSPDEQLLAALLNSQSRGTSTPPPRPKTTVASKLSPDEQFLAALLESQLKAALTPKPKTQTPAPKKLSPDEQFLAALLKSQLGGSSTSKPKPQVTSTKLTDDQLLAALLGGAQAGGSSRTKTQTRLTASASAAPATAQSPALLGGLLGQLGGRNTLPDPATLPTDEDDVDSPRGQRLVKAAIDVTKAVSQFMNVVIQGASERFQTFFRSGTSLLSNYFSWGSSQAGNFS